MTTTELKLMWTSSRSLKGVNSCMLHMVFEFLETLLSSKDGALADRSVWDSPFSSFYLSSSKPWRKEAELIRHNFLVRSFLSQNLTRAALLANFQNNFFSLS